MTKKRKGSDRFTHVGQVDVPTPGRVVVACDGASGNGHGFVSSSGHYGLLKVNAQTNSANSVASQVTVSELRAAWFAVKSLDFPCLWLLTDSQEAAAYIDHWRSGDVSLPDGYPSYRRGNPSTLLQFARHLAEEPDRVRVSWIKGHVGHKLNELADSLAKLARRSTNKEDAASIAHAWVENRRKSIIEAGRGGNGE